ncbi:MAG: thiolase family protein [Syntrophales bacterium]|jgi:acetyl-CoA C-acetyltransferase|nr:thiolase family protein [Syntrophales bacterium]MDY0043398.1 thiolase family protein [Syntrophales bacterium]
MKETVFVSAARTPIGKYMGSLKSVRIQDLAAHTMKAAVERAGIDSGALDMCIYSQSIQSSLPANVGRHAWTLAGLSEDPAGFTLNALCAGALQTIISGFNKIVGEEYKGMLVGGVESYSMAQYYIFHPRYEMGPHSMCFHDQKIEVETNAQPQGRYGELTASVLADIIADNYGFTRKDLDTYTIQDHEKALHPVDRKSECSFMDPYIIKMKKKEVSINYDQFPGKLTVEELMALPTLNEGGTATVANIAPWADAAASLIMLSAERAQELGCKPLVKMCGFGIAAGNPTLLERTSIKSIDKALAACGLSRGNIDFYNIHTPSAAYALAVREMLGEAEKEKINSDGGTLTFGLSGAAVGAILMIDMIVKLNRTGNRYGLVNVGALGGQSLSVIIENYN